MRLASLGAVFKTLTPFILTYTILYANTRYIYSNLISLAPALSLNALGEEIGLSGMDPYDYGWLPASTSIFVIFTLGFIIHLHSIEKKLLNESKSASNKIKIEGE
jgi:hypothetical protein